MPDEKRIAARARPHPDHPVEIQLMGAGFLDIFEARDISTTGAGIFTPYRFEGGDLQATVDLVITLPNGEPFPARGRVVHRTKTEREFFGVEFVDLPQDRILEIERCVEGRLAEDAPRERDLPTEHRLVARSHPLASSTQSSPNPTEAHRCHRSARLAAAPRPVPIASAVAPPRAIVAATMARSKAIKRALVARRQPDPVP